MLKTPVMKSNARLIIKWIGETLMKLTIGEKIALLRKEKNITQTELAEYLSLSTQTISIWEV